MHASSRQAVLVEARAQCSNWQMARRVAVNKAQHIRSCREFLRGGQTTVEESVPVSHFARFAGEQKKKQKVSVTGDGKPTTRCSLSHQGSHGLGGPVALPVSSDQVLASHCELWGWVVDSQVARRESSKE